MARKVEHPLDADSYDWRMAFQCCGPAEGGEDGENDGEEWLCVGRLKDGRWFILSAGCDYTGWDCQSGGQASVAVSFETLRRKGITDEQARRLAPVHPRWDAV